VKDEYIIVLDFLPRGHSNSRKSEPIAQSIGDKFLSLLEVAIKEGVEVKTGDRIYIGEKERDQVQYIKGRIRYDELTSFAKSELEYILDKIIESDEKRFVDFFNNAQPLSTRMHSLELLPGLGKKHMWEIVEERRAEPFKDFEDIKKRVKLLPDPKKLIIKRIVNEVLGQEKHLLFVG